MVDKVPEINAEPHQTLLPASPHQDILTPLTPPAEYFQQQQYVPAPVKAAPAPRLRTLMTRLRNFIYRTWFAEFVALFIALVFLALVAALCAIFDSQQLENEGFFSNTPSSLLNFFVSSMRTAMLLPVASGIAQLKWNWFNRQRQLSDIEVFDDASRGIVGSIKLLARPRFWSVTRLPSCTRR